MKKETKTKKYFKETTGITLIALVITIIVLLILAGISIGMVTGNNGIIRNAGKAKESTEIVEEKEIVEYATIKAIEKNRYGFIEEGKLNTNLKKIAGNREVKVYTDEEEYVVGFLDTNRYYRIDKDGNISQYNLIIDKNPGDITKDKDGNELDGVEKPFEIWNIEDLVVFSNMTRGDGYKLENGEAREITSAENFSGKKVVLKKDLNFKSEISYIDSKRTDFGNLNSNEEDENILINEMTTGTGFRPISNFCGSFDGETHEIRNFYINTDQNAAMFAGGYIKKIENFGITGNISTSGSHVAGIAASVNCESIDNCWNKANITGGTSTQFAAGICARDVSKITNCYNKGNITNTTCATGCAGGINSQLGSNEIEFCYNSGEIKGNHYAGGIASGHGNNKTSIKNCYNIANISSGNSVGGILGSNASLIEKCYNTGNVIGIGNVHAGGIVGTGVTNIIDCYNTGNIEGNYIHGICETLERKMVNCYNLGKFLSTSVASGSGLVRNCIDGSVGIYNSFHIGNVPGNPWNYSTGILQNNQSEIDMFNCYSDGEFIAYYWDAPYSYSPYGLVANNNGTININKCYYVKTEHVNTAVRDMEDNSEFVLKLNNLSELTTQMLNTNRETLTHTEEWREWIDGPDGYPILKFELDENGFIK